MRYAALYGNFECAECDELEALRQRMKRYRRSLRRCARRLRRECAERLRAVAAGDQKDRALAAICHDLRTPLNAVLGWLEVARITPCGPELDDALNGIENNARAQAALIEDLLDLTRGAGGTLRIDRRAVDLNEVATAAIDVVRPVAAAKGVELDWRPHPSPAVVIGDARRLQRVIWNLLTNAVKFTPAGGRVRLRVASDAAEVRLTVSDSGRGVRAEFLPRIFEPFAQDGPAHGGSTGVGLGPAIVRQLIESHAGRVTANSEGEGRGATFTVTLPAAGDQGPPGVPRQTALAQS